MSEIQDPGLAAQGRARIEWADAQMPVLRSIAERFAVERPLEGIAVGACLHVTSETANLIRALRAGGAEVALCAPNPLSTQDEIAAALVADEQAEVHAVNGEDMDAWAAHVAAVVATGPQVTLDDGADLVTAIHAVRRELLPRLIGGTEETTTGLVRLRALEADGSLACPIVAVNEAFTERAFNDRHGTGQSALDGIIRATNLLLAGRTFVVLGYGWTGQGVALRAKGLGASVVVCEVDPLRALEARMDGFEVMPALAAAERGDVFVTVTGARDVLGAEHFSRMKDGAVLANAGHFDVEIDVRALAKAATERREVRPLVDQYVVGGRRLNLLAQGRLVNLSAAEGHPAAVMDVSFALQALSTEHLVRSAGTLERRVHQVPPELEREVARLKLDSLGISIDELTPEQAKYLSSLGSSRAMSLLGRTAEIAEAYLASLPERPVGAPRSHEEMLAALDAPLPEQGEPAEAVLDVLASLEPGMVATAGPRYFGFVTGGALPVTVAADWLISTWDGPHFSHVSSPAGAAVEAVAERWVLDVLGLPASARVGFVTGATVANLVGLAAARHRVLANVGWDVEERGLTGAPPVRIVVGEEVHVALLKALRILGFGSAGLVRMPVDANGAMLADGLAFDGPTIVCAQAGNVNTGACDPLEHDRRRGPRGRGVGPRRRRVRAVGGRLAGSAPSGRRPRRGGLVGRRRA